MSETTPPEQTGQDEYDPVFVNSRREAIIIFCTWLAGLLWAVPICFLFGYERGYLATLDWFPQSLLPAADQFTADQLSTTWGIPTWLFWGIAVPWVVADVFTTWFCFCHVADDDLGEAHEGADIEEEVAELHAADARGKETDL